MITLVLGGRRSGKSAWAEQIAQNSLNAELVYVATCRNSDQSMEERIALHRQRREAQSRSWALIEEPLQLAQAVRRSDAKSTNRLFFIDCITIWISNLLEVKTEADVRAEITNLCSTLVNLQNDSIIISNEVGLGLAPATELGNKFIDMAGFANQELAKVAHEVAFIAAGLPLYLKRNTH